MDETVKAVLYATRYGMDMIHRDQCQDNAIKENVCEQICGNKDDVNDCKTDCNSNIIYKKNNFNRIWPDVVKYSEKTCTNDDECSNEPNGLRQCVKKETENKSYCAFSTLKDYSGNCVITSEKTCENLSRPFEICPPQATKEEDCIKDEYNRYTRWDVASGKCVYANDIARVWAEYPNLRYKQKNFGNPLPPFYYDKDTGGLYITPQYCRYQGLNYGTGSLTGNIYKPGDNPSNCKWNRSEECKTLFDPVGFFTESCRYVCVNDDKDSNGVIYCNTDDDCPTSNMKSYPNYKAMSRSKCIAVPGENIPQGKKGICIGDSSDCINTTAKTVLEDLGFGKTITDFITGAPITKECSYKQSPSDSTSEPSTSSTTNPSNNDVKEKFVEKQSIQDQMKKMIEKFNQIPYEISKFADSRYMVEKRLINKNIVNGINLYYIIWDNSKAVDFGMETKDDIGFDYDEVYKKYPELCAIYKDMKFIKINKKQLKNNDIKKIYVFSSSSSWMKNMVNHLSKNHK
jgi:hypothetical protein